MTVEPFTVTGCRGFPRGWLFLSGTFSCGCPKGLLGSPYSQHGTLWQARGGPQCLETIRAGDNRAIVLCRQR